MNERDMEDLIAAYPEDFFPRKEFVLVGRQQSLAGVGRFDLLFEDGFKSKILMELKALTLKYEDATQVANYRDELKRNGCKNVVMWLVSPQIPNSVREFLDDKGIEYTEIHVAEFRGVAERHDLVIKTQAERAEAQPTLWGKRTTRAAEHSAEESLTAMGVRKAIEDGTRFREAMEQLGQEWDVDAVAHVLDVHRKSAWKRIQQWEAADKIEKIRSGKRGRGGRLARYRFVAGTL